MIKPSLAAERMPHNFCHRAIAKRARVFVAAATLCLIAAISSLQDAARAQTTSKQSPGPIYVVSIEGPIDEINKKFLAERLEAASNDGAQLVLVQLDSPGFLGGSEQDAAELVDKVRFSKIPVAVWIGPSGAIAERGAFWVFAAAHIRVGSPFAKAGTALPFGIRSSGDEKAYERQGRFLQSTLPEVSDDAYVRTLEIEELTATGLVDFVAPTLGDAIVGLDGLSATVYASSAERASIFLRTADVITPEAGPPQRQPAVPVVFFRLGFVQRVLHASANPTIAYLLSMAAIVLFALEFYTAGIGIVALLGAICLLIGGYGLGAAGPNPITLIGLAASVPLFALDVQRGFRSVATTVAIVFSVVAVAAATFQGPSALRVPMWASIVLLILYIAAWRLGIVVMVRTRFWAPTIAREKLVGMRCIVRDPLTPQGTVAIGKARFPATSGAGKLIRGDEALISGISGWRLVVKKPEG